MTDSDKHSSLLQQITAVKSFVVQINQLVPPPLPSHDS